ncbi:hypothetical protein ACFE04_012123 [Oxalis oulophora]
MVFPKLLRACHSIARTNQQADIGAYPKTDGSDEKYILTDDQDDLVQVWSMDDLKIVACGDGHNSSVSGVASDSHWSVSNSDGNGELVLYWFGSVEGISGTISLRRRCKINQQLHRVILSHCLYPSQVMPVPWRIADKLHSNLCQWMQITFLEQYFKATNLHSKYFMHIFRDVAVSQ